MMPAIHAHFKLDSSSFIILPQDDAMQMICLRCYFLAAKNLMTR